MERDIKAERTFTSLADKLYFLCELSWEMLSTDQMSLNYRLFPDRIRRLFGDVVQEEKDLDHWHYDMMGQTMLIRNADGDYTWSSYFRRRVDQAGEILSSPPLRRFASESLEKLRETFGRSPLTKAVMDLLIPMLTPISRRGTALPCPYPKIGYQLICVPNSSSQRSKTDFEIVFFHFCSSRLECCQSLW
jgi:predicted NACHT family NTPase